MRLTGTSFIGFRHGTADGRTFCAVNPATGESLEPAYTVASDDDLQDAVRLAAEAAGPYGALSGKDKAAFLRKMADNIEAVVDELAQHAPLETALPEGRIRGETARTVGQLRMFANLVEEGSWVDARIDHADPDRQPVAKPDVRSMLKPLGPVVTFGVSNFPIAFSAAGGDSASALAAGNPVIVKAHAAHPGTSEIVAEAVRAAVQECGLPEGTFSLLYDDGNDIGRHLVQHPLIKGVGFTGSLAGGRALMDLAAARPEPIPVFAEMSSINPVFILPGAMNQRGREIAGGLLGSVTLGVGQFCTCPSVVIAEASAETEAFAAAVVENAQASPAGTMLTDRIGELYMDGLARLSAKSTVQVLSEADRPGGPAVLSTDVASFVSDPELQQEVFGPSTMIVQHRDIQQMLDVAKSLEGQLTATIHGTEDDLVAHQELVEVLSAKAGRLIFNGYPTGVEVCHAMVHGGPYPASSDGRTTSVGSAAIFRFARPVCYQDFPDVALPDALREDNPLDVWRLVDGERTK